MMDEQLKQLYRARWESLSKLIRSERGMSTPLLAAVPKEYEDSKIRLLIIGKETHDWLSRQSLSAPDPVEELRNGYRNFERGRGWRSPFFQAARRLQKRLNPDSDESGFMWLNLFACDQDMRTPKEPIAERLRNISFLRDEIAILKPDAVVFFTGPVYDYTIKHSNFFPDVKFEPHSKWWSKVQATGLPRKAVRTYHPKYLRLKKQFGVLDEISDWIKQT